MEELTKRNILQLTSCINECITATERTETFEKGHLKLFFSAISVAKRTFARGLIQTSRVRLHAEYDFLWNRWNIVHWLWVLPTQVAGIAGGGLLDDRVGPALRGGRKLSGEQEV